MMLAVQQVEAQHCRERPDDGPAQYIHQKMLAKVDTAIAHSNCQH